MPLPRTKACANGLRLRSPRLVAALAAGEPQVAAATLRRAELSDEQWLQLIPVLQQRKLIPFLDMAYQGFGRSLDEDAFAVRAMVDAGLTFLLANSFSKNFSYYSERCGGLSVVCQSADEADRVLGQPPRWHVSSRLGLKPESGVFPTACLAAA